MLVGNKGEDVSVGSLAVYLARRKHQVSSNYKRALERDKSCVCPHARMRVHECVRQSLADFKLAVQDCIELILDHPALAS